MIAQLIDMIVEIIGIRINQINQTKQTEQKFMELKLYDLDPTIQIVQSDWSSDVMWKTYGDR